MEELQVLSKTKMKTTFRFQLSSIDHVENKASVKRAGKTCKLFCDIAAKRLFTTHVQTCLQQIRLLSVRKGPKG